MFYIFIDYNKWLTVINRFKRVPGRCAGDFVRIPRGDAGPHGLHLPAGPADGRRRVRPSQRSQRLS